MSTEFLYSLGAFVELPQILQWRDELRGVFQDYSEFDAGTTINLRFPARKMLLPLHLPDGVDLPDILIMARFPPLRAPLEVFRRMLTHMAETWAETGSLEVGCRIADGPDSRQSPGRSDEAGVKLQNGMPRFAYSACNSRLSREAPLRRDYFRFLIQYLDLPMVLVDTDRGYVLQHTANGDVWVSCNDYCGCSYREFSCDIPGCTVDGLVHRMDRFLRSLEDRPILNYTWSLLCHADPSRPMLGKDMYDWAAAVFPIQSATVDFSCRLRRIESLDSLRTLIGRKGSFYSPICRFRVSEEEGEWGELNVLTRAEGHRVELSLTSPEYKKRVEQVLGLHLKRKGVF